MDRTNTVFLKLLKNALLAEPESVEEEISLDQWKQILDLAQAHKVLPMIYQAAFKTPALRENLGALDNSVKRQVMGQVMMQTIRSSEFLALYQKLLDAGVRALVVKGIVCRNLYAEPDNRPSGDEDLLIRPEEFQVCHRVFTEFGLQAQTGEADFSASHEVSYRKAGSPLHIELHKALFPPESEAYGDWNRFFKDAQIRAVAENIQGITLYTLGYTDHLFYLLCHAFKHFLHSGFGIRQVCDIVMYANAYGRSIDWEQILKNCRQIRGELFAAAVFRIGQKYLVFDPEQAAYPRQWQDIPVDEVPMLEDLLQGGLYGDSSMSRKHSSSITLDAVAAQKQGKKAKHGAVVSLFPPASKLTGRYPYLKRRPWLLPAAWCQRMADYLKETHRSQNNSAAQALKIGSERIELMKTYGIIK